MVQGRVHSCERSGTKRKRVNVIRGFMCLQRMRCLHDHNEWREDAEVRRYFFPAKTAATVGVKKPLLCSQSVIARTVDVSTNTREHVSEDAEYI